MQRSATMSMWPLFVVGLVCGCQEAANARGPVVPEAKGLLVSERAGNVTLYISTEGTEETPVDLEVLVDGVPTIRGEFGEGDLHPFYVEYEFDWPPGPHEVSVSSSKVDRPTSLQVDVTKPVWIVVTYGYAPAHGLSIRAFDEAVKWR